MIKNNLFIGVVPTLLMVAPLCPQSEVTKWQDGKDACISITYDDSSINQFRVAIPLMNERGLPGTFFIITGDIDGSKYQPAFIGRPIKEILRESEKTPTTKENMLERTYSKHIGDFSDALYRRALLDTAKPAVGNVVALPVAR